VTPEGAGCNLIPAKTRIPAPFLGLVSAAFSLYNIHSKGVNSAQRLNPTRFICLCVARRQVPNATSGILSELSYLKALGIKRYTLAELSLQQEAEEMSDKPTVDQGDSRNPSGQSEKRAQRRRPVLKIVLDTNQLFTGSASDLLQLALRQVIEASRTHRDIEIEWHVPEVVRSEREYQMTDAAIELLPTITKLERLLGHNLGINTDILASRVRDAIERQVKELGLKILPLNEKDIDWQCVIRDAVFRKPPFEKGKTEKGFRDRLIAESFLQLVRNSPRTPSVCRVALVTNDGLLATTVEAETKTLENVRIVKSLEDLQNLINTLVSSATEEFVAAVRQPAMELFFKEGSKDGLYYTEKVPEAIVAKFAASLAALSANIDETLTRFEFSVE